jgi:ketosteroid isomerase-like protein
VGKTVARLLLAEIKGRGRIRLYEGNFRNSGATSSQQGSDGKPMSEPSTTPPSPRGAALAFVEAINRRNSEALAALMTEDHAFVDGLGAKIEGRQQVKAAFEVYFRMVPDYTVSIEETFGAGSVVVMLGAAQGTYSRDGNLRQDDHWTTPAAWRVSIRDGLVAEWRVFADNEPIRQIMRRR